jgi:hypothetical protein
MSFEEKQFTQKLGLTVPSEHKYLSYIPKSLDLIFFYDKPDAFKAYLDRYPHIQLDCTLKACIEYGASACFKEFFDNTRSASYYFERLFIKPEIPSMGVQCAFYYIKNNQILNTMNEICAKFFPGKTTTDLLNDKEQIEHCAARFGIKGRVNLAKKLLDKLDNPLYMVNNMPIFDSIYSNKSNEFAKIYLEKIEEKKLVKNFLLSFFSRVNLKINDNKNLNFFDRFSKELGTDTLLHSTLNDFLVRNIQNDSISKNFQELMMAYCLHNNNWKDFELYYNAKPITEQNIVMTARDSWSVSEIKDEVYRDMKNSTNSEVFLENNAIKKFHYNTSILNQWYQTNKELNNLKIYSSVCSLFCLGKTTEIESTIIKLSEKKYIDWQIKDEEGNNFAHYLANFFEKIIKTQNNSSNGKAMFNIAQFLVNNDIEVLISPNNKKIMPGEILIKLIKTDSIYNNYLSPEQQQSVLKMEKALEYAELNNDLGHNTSNNTKRLKI